MIPAPAERASGPTDIAAHVPKPKTHFTCQSCGRQSPKWLGRCTDCGSWRWLVEESEARDGERRAAWGTASSEQSPIPLHQVAAETQPRRATGIHELDRVLGGGVVPGSLVLLGGDPGIGKSTLLLAAIDRLSREVPA